MKARDVMIPIRVCLHPKDKIEVFVSKMREARACEKTCGIKALPVLNSSGRLVGVISMFDILKAMHPAYLNNADLHAFTWDGMLESLAEKVRGKTVSDFLTLPVRVVRADHPLMECVDLMLKNRFSCIPVIDRDDNPVGMLYDSDVFFAVGQALEGGK